MGERTENNQLKELNQGIKKYKNWLQSKNTTKLLKEKKTGFGLIAGIIFSIGAGAIATLATGGSALALSIASWAGVGLANEAIFSTVWDEIKKQIMKSIGKDITDKEVADYILKIAPNELNAIATAVCNKFKDDPEIKLFLIDIVKNAVQSDDFKEMLGQVLSDKIKNDMEAQHREILDEVRKCGIRSFYEILTESQKIDFKSVFEKFRRTIRLCPEELVCVITNGGTIERTLESDVIRNLDNGKKVLILGISGSGKTVFLMRVCYRLHLDGWKVFFTDECIDSQKSRELFVRTEGKKILIIDNAAIHDEYFDLIKNLRSDIRIVMAEQDIIWA
ncbi:MAG: ATP-binding protein, partial [Thermoplasmata archaeon]|nr:ATP-binding protein [Thermoplasmata archaeon]